MNGNDDRYILPSKQAIINRAADNCEEIADFVIHKEDGKYHMTGIVVANAVS